MATAAPAPTTKEKKGEKKVSNDAKTKVSKASGDAGEPDAKQDDVTGKKQKKEKKEKKEVETEKVEASKASQASTASGSRAPAPTATETQEKEEDNVSKRPGEPAASGQGADAKNKKQKKEKKEKKEVEDENAGKDEPCTALCILGQARPLVNTSLASTEGTKRKQVQVTGEEEPQKKRKGDEEKVNDKKRPASASPSTKPAPKRQEIAKAGSQDCLFSWPGSGLLTTEFKIQVKETL
jgi:hypothetical protein